MQRPHDRSGNRKRRDASPPQASFRVPGSKAWKMPAGALCGALRSCRMGPARRPRDWTLTASVDATRSKAMVHPKTRSGPGEKPSRPGRLRCGTGARRTKRGCRAPQSPGPSLAALEQLQVFRHFLQPGPKRRAARLGLVHPRSFLSAYPRGRPLRGYSRSLGRGSGAGVGNWAVKRALRDLSARG
jgi:hypothetical protein